MNILRNLKITILSIMLAFTTFPTYAAELSGPGPDFTLKSLSGKNIKLSELRGEVIMLNFWASWCAPCRQEMPILEKIYQKYQPLGFTLLGVNVEENSDDAKAYLKDVEVSFPILFDNQNKVSQLYDVIAMPSTIMIDRDGNMRYLHQGYKPGAEEEYVRYVKTLLKE